MSDQRQRAFTAAPMLPGPRAAARRRLLGAATGLLGALLAPAAALRAAAQDGDAAQPLHRRRGRTLLRGGTVLTMDRAVGDFSQADVLIAGERIEAVAPRVHAHDADVIDATGMIVMPGFVDSHRHMWQGLLRNIGPDDLLGDYLAKILFGFAPLLTPEEVQLGDLLTGLSALNAGITCILDWSHIATSPAHTDGAIAGLQASGIRAVYGYGPNFGLPTPWYNDPNSAYPGDVHRLRRQYFSSSDQLLTLALAAAGPEFANVDAAVREWTIAREVGARISSHIGVGLLGRQGLFQQLAARVPLRDDTTYIHCCTLGDDDWARIAASGGTISLAVPIEMQMGHGMPPIQKALDHGIRPSLSIDVETNQPSDMFTQMRACFALQRAFVNEAHLFGGPEPDRARLLTVRDVLEFATLQGARANGLAAKVGSLAPGKQADIVMLRARQINTSPVNNATGAVVLGMDASNVDSVFVAGKPLKRQGRLVGVDVNRILREADQARDAILARAGSPR
jgi:5-methylthioadenosine/S-adenosylhomocysteine deaminase